MGTYLRYVDLAPTSNPFGGGGPDPEAPVVSTQPLSRGVFEAATAQFTVVATGTGTLTYQWQVNDGTWRNVAASGEGTGVTTASYTTQATTLAMHTYQYRCVVTNNVGSVNSNPATLAVAPTGPRAWFTPTLPALTRTGSNGAIRPADSSTIIAMLPTLVPGDVVVLAAGTYPPLTLDGIDGTLTDWISFVPAAGATVTVQAPTGGAGVALLVHSSSFIHWGNAVGYDTGAIQFFGGTATATVGGVVSIGGEAWDSAVIHPAHDLSFYNVEVANGERNYAFSIHDNTDGNDTTGTRNISIIGGTWHDLGTQAPTPSPGGGLFAGALDEATTNNKPRDITVAGVEIFGLVGPAFTICNGVTRFTGDSNQIHENLLLSEASSDIAKGFVQLLGKDTSILAFSDHIFSRNRLWNLELPATDDGSRAAAVGIFADCYGANIWGNVLWGISDPSESNPAIGIALEFRNQGGIDDIYCQHNTVTSGDLAIRVSGSNGATLPVSATMTVTNNIGAVTLVGAADDVTVANNVTWVSGLFNGPVTTTANSTFGNGSGFALDPAGAATDSATPTRLLDATNRPFTREVGALSVEE